MESPRSFRARFEGNERDTKRCVLVCRLQRVMGRSVCGGVIDGGAMIERLISNLAATPVGRPAELNRLN